MGNARVKTRRTRRQTAGKFKIRKPQWQDPYPWIEGTEPEKRVFEALMLRRIYFIYQGQVPEFEAGSPQFFRQKVSYKPDFILPEYRLIIDPFSPFHHSLKAAAERDAIKIPTFGIAGYAYYHPWAIAPGVWDWDQYRAKVDPKRNSYRLDRSQENFRGRMDTQQMLGSIPEINAGPRYPLTDPRDIAAKMIGYRLGQFLGAGANSVAAANRQRRKPPKIALKVGTRSR